MKKIILLLSSLLVLTACSEKIMSPNLVKHTISDNETSLFLNTTHTQLATPNIIVDSMFFKESATLSAAFDYPGAAIFYRIEEAPFQKYIAPIQVNQSSTITFLSRKEDIQDSESIQITVQKLTSKLEGAAIQVHPAPHKNYPAAGASSLVDQKKGGKNFRQGKYWTGFLSDTVTVDLELDNLTTLNTIILSLLSDHSSYIFLPKALEVWSDDKQIGGTTVALPSAEEKSALTFLPVPLKTGKYQNLKVLILQYPSLPDWHPGKGSKPWLFIDEIIAQ